MSQPTLIAVDIGNSSTKLGWFTSVPANNALPSPNGTHSFKTGQPPSDDLSAKLPGGALSWHIVSVHREGSRILQDWLSSHRRADEVRVLSPGDLPIEVRLEQPDRVGMDRLAAAVAANVIRSRSAPAIVVDAGSAITVDLVAADGSFQGGAILPGFRMQAEALYGADLLPLTELRPNDELPVVVGKDTQAAIRSGLFWGTVGAVREIIGRMASQLSSPPNVFITGGDLRQLANYLGDEARFVPNMVLSGIAVAAVRR
jgi:type III pantothenate kinase